MSSETAERQFLQETRKRLPQVRESLSRIVHEREQDFLDLGAALQDFAVRADSLSNQVTELAQTASGETMVRFSEELNAELEQMKSLCSMSTSEANLAELGRIQGEIESLEALILTFKKIVRSLQMLGISTHIESARLGAAGRGFSTLADDVEGLAQNIVTHSSQILGNSKRLNGLVRSAREQTEQMRDSQEECSSKVFQNIRNNMQSVMDLSQTSQRVSDDLQDRARETAANIGGAVSAIQFHDIIRQQVEHVDEALDDMLQMLTDNMDGEDEDEQRREYIGFVGDVCALQASQLDNAGNRFIQAVDQLKENLQGIAQNVLGLADAGREITRGDTAGGGTVLERMEENVQHAMESMRTFATQGEQIGSVMVSVANTITEITSFLGDIEEVGSEIELIALNASIKAAHTGDKGAALGVLASSIQRLSQDARGLTESTADVLRTIYSSAETLKQNAESYMDTSQVESMVMRLAELVENLRRVNDEMVGAFAGTSSRAEELGRDIQKQTQSITFHAAVGNRLLEGRDRMEATSARAQELVPHEDDEGRPERLRKLLDRYTMEAERMIHETAFNLESMEEGAGATGEEAGADGEDDWDNVELF